MSVVYGVILCGLLSIAYAVWATRAVLAADQGNARMREIAGFIREGATAILQAGGSIRDFESIAACNQADPQVAMMFTGSRSFKH